MEKQSAAALPNAYHWVAGGSRVGVDRHPHVAQSARKKSMSAIYYRLGLHLILTDLHRSVHKCLSDIVLLSASSPLSPSSPPRSRRYPDPPEIRQHLWGLLLETDVALQAEIAGKYREESGSTGATLDRLARGAANTKFIGTTFDNAKPKPLRSWRFLPDDPRPTTGSPFAPSSTWRFVITGWVCALFSGWRASGKLRAYL